jgi:hypothetical protein
MFLLDTNVVSELRKSRTPRIDPNVDAWVAHVSTLDMYLSAIVIEELAVGILRAERQDPPFGALLRNWFSTHVVPTFPNASCRSTWLSRWQRRRFSSPSLVHSATA